MSDLSAAPPPLTTLQQARDGVADILPALLAAAPIGLVYGALCTTRGLSPAAAGLSSALIFAGGAQFTALELWRHPPQIITLAFSTLLVNARHVLMGASLKEKAKGFGPARRIVGYLFLADEIWAMSERRAARRPLAPAYYFAMALALYANWVICTFAGAFAGALMGDPKRLGADFVFTALFIGLVAGFWRGRSSAAVVAASLLASAGAYATVGAPWHVLAGASAGLAAAWFTAGWPASDPAAP
jgi:4-azaleucine resistance transporter AzlC